jgi:hypothetical protein
MIHFGYDIFNRLTNFNNWELSQINSFKTQNNISQSSESIDLNVLRQKRKRKNNIPILKKIPLSPIGRTKAKPIKKTIFNTYPFQIQWMYMITNLICEVKGSPT